MSLADDLLPRSVRGAFADQRYASLHGSFINLRDDAIYDGALFELVRVAGRFERDGNILPAEFWRLIDDLAVDCDSTDDYLDWRSGLHDG